MFKVIFYFIEKKIETEIYTPGWLLTDHIAEDDLELMILLPLRLQCWGNRCPPPYQFMQYWNSEI